jgi:hypothetical protein
MLVGHLAPIGPIAAAVARRWESKWPQWTRLLPWAAATVGCVFPDLDIIANVVFNGLWFHLYLMPHSVLPYLPLLLVAILLARWHRARLVGWTLLAFCYGVLSHLLLDAASHGTVLLCPLWNGPVGWTFPPTHHVLLQSYVRSPNFWLEPGVMLAAAMWWLRRVVLVRPIADRA